MKQPAWIKLSMVLLCAATVVALALAVIAWRALDAVEQQLAHAEGQLADLVHPDGATQAAAERLTKLGGQVAALEKQNGELVDRVDALLLKLLANGRRLDALEAGDLEDLGIEELIDRKLGEKIADGRQRLAARRRPPLDRLGEHLELSERQKQRVAQVIDRAKEDVLEVMTAARGDDRSLMDDLSDALREPGTPKEKKQRILSQMFSESPPGSDESYFSTIIDIRGKAIDDFRGILTQDQIQKFKGLNVDLFGIQTGYSPFVDYFRQTVTGGQ